MTIKRIDLSQSQIKLPDQSASAAGDMVTYANLAHDHSEVYRGQTIYSKLTPDTESGSADSAPIEFTSSSTLMSTPENYAIEDDGIQIWFTSCGIRHPLIPMTDEGLFMGGLGPLSSVEKYGFSTAIVCYGTSLDAARSACCGWGSAIVGYCYSGAGETSTRKYAFLTDTVISGSDLRYVYSYNDSACGNESRGIVAGNSVGPAGYTDKYTYATDIVTGGTNVSSGTYIRGACSNSTKGVITKGTEDGNFFYDDTQEYTFSTDAVAAGTDLTVARYGVAAFSNQILGIFCGGWTGALSKVTDKYTFATSAVTAGSDLAAARYAAGDCANAVVGVVENGIDPTNPIDSGELYTFSTGAYVSTTKLVSMRAYCATAAPFVSTL